MRRRRKSKFTWFPVLGSNFGDTPPINRVSTFFTEVVVPHNNGTAPTIGAGLAVLPIIPDFTPQEDGAALFTLQDFVQGQDYILKRIVGKCFVSTDFPNGTTDTWPSVLVTAGFFIARAQEDNSIDIALDDESVDPEGLINVQNPWIWRRQWMLGCPGNLPSAFGTSPNFPQNNAQFSGVLDGPHIDSKVARRVVREQRLWFALSAMGISSTDLHPVGTTDCTVRAALDVRILGAMRRGRNLSAF